ncbi:MAG: hypothetical protein ABFD64_05645 [Armatimonadota bacterium]
MKEIITQERVDSILKLIAIAAPLAGLVIGTAVGIIRKRIAAGTMFGIIIGLSGTALFGLWRMYTTFGNSFGYTNIVCLAVQFAIFSGIGIGAGFAIQRSRNIMNLHEVKGTSEEELLNASKDI